jgi:hypothetical protein
LAGDAPGAGWGQRARRAWWRVIASLGLAVILVGLSSCGEVIVSSRVELRTLWFGSPFPYLRQNQAFWVNPEQYPYAARFGDPYNYPWEFFWLPWLGDLVLAFLLVMGLQLLIQLVRSRVGPA